MTPTPTTPEQKIRDIQKQVAKDMEYIYWEQAINSNPMLSKCWLEVTKRYGELCREEGIREHLRALIERINSMTHNAHEHNMYNRVLESYLSELSSLPAEKQSQEKKEEVPLAESWPGFEKFYHEMGEDYHLWDESTQGAYPIQRIFDAMNKMLKEKQHFKKSPAYNTNDKKI